MKRLLIGTLVMAGAVMLDGCKKDEAVNDALSVIAARTSVRRYDATREVSDEIQKLEGLLAYAVAHNENETEEAERIRAQLMKNSGGDIKP